MRSFLLSLTLVLIVAAVGIRADLLECDEKKVPSLADLPIIGPKVVSNEDTSVEHEVSDFFKNVGCQIKKGATKVTEQAKKLGTELKEGAIKLGEKAKDLGKDLKTKIDDFKDKLSQDSSEEQHNPRGVPANVEIINPDILKSEQMCGHGHILDALGNCSKLRK